jgi:anhydro-N-acetylmuramic acid kinase
LKAIGLMSGTSMDGIDVALLETDGETVSAFGKTGSRAYTPAERAVIAAAVAQAPAITDRNDRSGVFGEAEHVVTEAHAEAVERFLDDNGLSAADIDAVGFHGQTIWHRPEKRLTVQIGDGPALAARLGIDVVHDLRAADVAAGGQGAPFVPVYHQALAAHAGLELPVVVANLGGVGNVTYLSDAPPLAFDTGPANALIDDWVSARAGVPFDDGGRIAAAGRVEESALRELLKSPYFLKEPPKSLDRNDFSVASLAALSLEDGAATLAAFTAASLALAGDWFPAPARQWIVVGGGARNPTLMAMLRDRLGAPVVTGAEIGWSGDHVEAQAFAYLAVRSLRGLPLTFPTTTGVPEPLAGGVLAKAR